MDEEHMFQQLKELAEIPGPVGREILVQTYMEEQVRTYTPEVIKDPVGNLLAHFPGKGVKTVVAAHACEIGFVVNCITGDGLLKIAPNYETRSADTRILPFHDVTILTDTYDKIPGFFTIDTGHTVDIEMRKKVPALKDVSVDIGVTSESEARSLGIDVGCPVTWDVKTTKMGTCAKGKAMDDRLGLVILLRLAAFLSDNTVDRDMWLASTVQEEIGVRGARALASQQKFDEAIILEITPVARSDKTVQLGAGPAIIYKDGSMHYHHQSIVHYRKTAYNHGIPLQPALLERGITDGLGFFTNAASKTVLLGCPTLYPHSPGETIDLTDLHNLGNLCECVLTQSCM
jgi:putative aminopeptidase FrvX